MMNISAFLIGVVLGVIGMQIAMGFLQEDKPGPAALVFCTAVGLAYLSSLFVKAMGLP